MKATHESCPFKVGNLVVYTPTLHGLSADNHADPDARLTPDSVYKVIDVKEGCYVLVAGYHHPGGAIFWTEFSAVKQHTRPLWFAVLVTPWAVPLVFIVWATLWLFLYGGSFEGWSGLLAFFVFCLPPAYAAMLVFGLPYVLWLRSRSMLTCIPVCIGAVFASVVVPYAWGRFVDPQIPPTAAGMLVFGLLGLLSGIVFCIAAGISFRAYGRRTRTA